MKDKCGMEPGWYGKGVDKNIRVETCPGDLGGSGRWVDRDITSYVHEWTRACIPRVVKNRLN